MIRISPEPALIWQVHEDGSMSIYDAETGKVGWPVRAAARSGVIHNVGDHQVVQIPLVFHGANLRETDKGLYYTQTLNLTIGLDVMRTQELTVQVEVIGAADGDACTYVPAADKKRAASSQQVASTGLPSSLAECICNNDCANAPRDGSCDDGGPGFDYAGCDLGTDCAVSLTLPVLDLRAGRCSGVRARQPRDLEQALP